MGASEFKVKSIARMRQIFEQNYITKESQWPENFRQWMVTSKERHRSTKDTLQHCMLKTVRIAAGLGNPPNKHLCPEMHAMTKMTDFAKELHN